MPGLEAAALNSHSLRILAEYLAEETQAERINIIGYSAGSRVMIVALDQFSLIYQCADVAAFKYDLSIWQVILVGSDYDRDLFAAALVNGLLNLPERLTIYLSETDRATGISQRVFGRNRLGQMWQERPLKPPSRRIFPQKRVSRPDRRHRYGGGHRRQRSCLFPEQSLGQPRHFCQPALWFGSG
jgi:hypothetical protein